MGIKDKTVAQAVDLAGHLALSKYDAAIAAAAEERQLNFMLAALGGKPAEPAIKWDTEEVLD